MPNPFTANPFKYRDIDFSKLPEAPKELPEKKRYDESEIARVNSEPDKPQTNERVIVKEKEEHEGPFGGPGL